MFTLCTIWVALLCTCVSQAFISSYHGSAVRPPTRGMEGTRGSSLSMGYNKVFVAGGGSGVGRAVVDELVKQGSQVVALVRREDAKSELEAIDGVSAVICDALDLKGVEGVLDGCDAAISTLGGAPEGDEQKRVDYVGNRNVIESAGILGITRLVLVTSVGCGSSRGAISDKVYQVLEKALRAKTLAEDMLQKYYTNSDWTIIRPGGLKTASATDTAIVTDDTQAAGIIHRADVAKLVVRALNSPNATRKIFTAIDPGLATSDSTPAPVEL